MEIEQAVRKGLGNGKKRLRDMGVLAYSARTYTYGYAEPAVCKLDGMASKNWTLLFVRKP